MGRLADVVRFYALLDRLEQRLSGTRTLATFSGYSDWPHRGLYLFFEPSEVRQESGNGPKIVRVGTHAIIAGSRSTLRQRLRQHRGQASGGGNHRGSIFRLLVGQALITRGDVAHCASWGVKGDTGKACLALNISRDALAAAEAPVELAVTNYLSTMPFLWLDIDDPPGPESLRGVIERNAIALLSNHNGPAVDPPSPSWLGHFSDRPQVRASGLWNQRHVEETYDPVFLKAFERMIA
jgi:hypothetical protein